MISTISPINYYSNPYRAQERLSAPGIYTKPQLAEQIEKEKKNKKKRRKIIKALAEFLVAVSVVGIGVVLGFQRGVFKLLPESEKSGASLMKKAGHKLAKAGEWLEKKVIGKIDTPDTPLYAEFLTNLVDVAMI